MKIIIVGTAHPYRGGLAAFNERLAKQLSDEGHQVQMCTFTLQYPKVLFPGKTQYTDSPAPKGVGRIERMINSCNPFNWISTGLKLRRENADLVIFAYWMFFFAPCYGTIARIIRSNGCSRCIGLIHNMIPHEPNFLDKLFPGWFVRAMDGFVALSESVIEDICKFDKTGKPKGFAPHPIYDHYGQKLDKEDARELLGIPREGKYVLFFGFIREYKGLDLLIDAFASQRLSDVKLIVAGEFYGDSKPYFDRIETLGLKDRVLMFNDYIPDDRVNRFFSACDLVAQPYKSATQSGVTQIAFHFEKPMLVSNVGGLPEIVPDGVVGYVVEPEPSAIADAIGRFYENNAETALIEGVRGEKKKYSWDRLTKTILSI